MQKSIPPGEPAVPNYPIASVDNALRLLLLFKEQSTVRLIDACQYLGVAHSTGHRLLAMLAFHGFVRKDPASRAYVAGPALVDVGLAVVRTLDVRGRARPVLEKLAAEFDETAHLAILEGNEVRYLDAVESSQTLRVTARTGALVPAHCTSVGKALLAVLSRPDLHALYPEPDRLPLRTSQSIATLARLEEELDRVRACGYALNVSESEEGVGSVAIAYRDLNERHAAIAIAAPVNRMDDSRTQAMAVALTRAVEGARYIIGV